MVAKKIPLSVGLQMSSNCLLIGRQTVNPENVGGKCDCCFLKKPEYNIKRAPFFISSYCPFLT